MNSYCNLNFARNLFKNFICAPLLCRAPPPKLFIIRVTENSVYTIKLIVYFLKYLIDEVKINDKLDKNNYDKIHYFY